MWNLLTTALAVNTINLDTIPELEFVNKNCQPKLSFNEIKGELVNVVAVFRHGDRAPLKISNDLWRTKTCVTCKDKCERTNCSDGMLTLKGLNQSKKLGEYINKNYVPRITPKKIFAFHSSLARSFTTLQGVLSGLDIQDVDIKQENSLLTSSVANSIKNYILKQEKSELKVDSLFDYTKFDDLVTSYCSATPYPFKGDSFSSINEMSKFYSEQTKSLLKILELTKVNFITKGISLGEFGEFIKKQTTQTKSISLVSSHDSTLIKLLQGLNVNIDFIPPYSSTIFIEVWKNVDNVKFVRVIYEGEVMKIGLYKENMVQYENFIQYLDMFNIANTQIKNINRVENEQDTSPKNIKRLATITKDVYKPIITEIKKETGLDAGNFLHSFLASPFNGIKNGYSNLKSRLIGDNTNTNQYLFGWFSSKKKEKMIKFDKEITDKKGKVYIYTIECPQSGKGECKTISKKKSEKKKNETYSVAQKIMPLRLVNNEKCEDSEMDTSRSACVIRASKTACEGQNPCKKPVLCAIPPKNSAELCLAEQKLKVLRNMQASCNKKPMSSFDCLPGVKMPIQTVGCSVVNNVSPMPSAIFGPKPCIQ